MTVIIVLKVRAELEGVAKIVFPPDHEWILDVQQSGSDGSEQRKGITISNAEEFEVKGSKGTAHFVMKWEGRKDQSTMSIFTPNRKSPLKGKTLGQYTAEDSGQFVAVAAFECKGVEPINWTPSVGYEVENVKGGVHKDVDLSEREWCDYDADNELSVSICDLQWQFESAGR